MNGKNVVFRAASAFILGVLLFGVHPTRASAVVLPDDFAFIVEDGKMITDNSVVHNYLGMEIELAVCTDGICRIHQGTEVVTLTKIGSQVLSYDQWFNQVRLPSGTCKQNVGAGPVNQSGCDISSGRSVYESEYLNPIKEHSIYSKNISIPSTRGLQFAGGGRFLLLDIKRGVIIVPQSTEELRAAGVPAAYIDNAVTPDKIADSDLKKEDSPFSSGRTLGISALAAIIILGLIVAYRRRK